ncbi:hypothetical protein LDO32_08525 [Luteimonas sp. Y-2-2-4F]|nr:hypothetical protein [Luteimonas sp. Y-2-2-4F]MCD9031766.1 hypothetical protein [Luteimonas sp. Y-2-2-4F]
MKTVNRLLLAACLALPLAACQKDEAPQQVERAPVAVPTTEASADWRAYLQDLVPRHMEGITNQPYIYLVPGESTDDFQGNYDRLLEKASTDLQRGIVRGNLLAYAGPNPAKVADLASAAFQGVPAGSMQGVRVLYIGSAAENERVKAAVEPAGVEYVFVEAK